MRVSGSWLRLRPWALTVVCLASLQAFSDAVRAAQPAPPASDRAPVLSAAQAQYESLFACPTTLDHIGRVVVPVEVDGRGPFRFIIDTGAGHSTISPWLVKELGLPVSKVPAIDVEGVTGSAAVPAVQIQTLRAGSLVIRDVALPVLETPMMAGVDGILGVAGMRDITLLVDFARNRVQVARGLNAEVRFDYSRVHTTMLAGGLIALPAYIGDVQAVAIIDTGAERSLGNLALSTALHLQTKPGKLDPVTAVYGATQQVQSGKMVATPIIAIGPLRIAGLELVYGGFHIFNVWGLENRPAVILGMDVLGTVDGLGFDFDRHELYVGRARGSGDLFSTARSFDAAGAGQATRGIH